MSLCCRVNHVMENNDGSKLTMQMDYSPLPPINLEEEEPINVIQRMYKVGNHLSHDGHRNVIVQQTSIPYVQLGCLHELEYEILKVLAFWSVKKTMTKV